jgi:hypothetical protein
MSRPKVKANKRLNRKWEEGGEEGGVGRTNMEPREPEVAGQEEATEEAS